MGLLRSEVCDRPVAVVGDIHGCADLLAELLVQLGDIPVIVVGDVGDRGPDTRGVIDQLVARDATGVLGNHDEWLRTWARRGGFDSFALNPLFGGCATLDSYGVHGKAPREIEAEAWRVPSAHREWLDRLAVAIDLQVCGEKFWVVHAPFSEFEGPPEMLVPGLAERDPARLIWGNSTPENMPPLDRPVIVGHVPRAEPLDSGHVIALDTGAGTLDGGRLTAVLLPERRFVTVAGRG